MKIGGAKSRYRSRRPARVFVLVCFKTGTYYRDLYREGPKYNIHIRIRTPTPTTSGHDIVSHTHSRAKRDAYAKRNW